MKSISTEEQYTSSAITDFLDRLKGAALSGLLLDYDGTLAPFHDDRHQAFPYAGVIPFLKEILQSGKTRVAIVTGRPVHEVQALLKPLESVEIWGAHGLEHLLSDGRYRQAAIDPQMVETLSQAEEQLRANGLISHAEIKPGGIAMHWRGLSEQEIVRIRETVQEGWAAFVKQPGIKLLSFEGGLELRITRPDKGDAIATILQELGSSVPVAFLGDDLTDEDAFEALQGRGLPILVRPEYRETKASAWIRPPQELIGFFERWLRGISV